MPIHAFCLTRSSRCIYTFYDYSEFSSNLIADGFIGSYTPPRHSRCPYGVPGRLRNNGLYGNRRLGFFGFTLYDGDHLIHDRVRRSQPGQSNRADFHPGSDCDGGWLFSLCDRQRRTISGGRPHPADIREAQIGQTNRPIK